MDPPKKLYGTQCNFSSKITKLLCSNPFFPAKKGMPIILLYDIMIFIYVSHSKSKRMIIYGKKSIFVSLNIVALHKYDRSNEILVHAFIQNGKMKFSFLSIIVNDPFGSNFLSSHEITFNDQCSSRLDIERRKTLYILLMSSLMTLIRIRVSDNTLILSSSMSGRR